MKRIYEAVSDLIGNTPLVALERCFDAPHCTLLAKLESFNPAGSAKDRVALAMIRDAEEKGLLKEDSVIIEPTSGNTGIGLAAVASTRGYQTVIVMPDSMSKERQTLMQAYGAKLVLTPGKLGMTGAIEKARELAAQIPNSFIPGQFENPANPAAHYQTTAPEIWRDTEGKLDIFVAGVGTGGTITGVGRFLKEKDPSIQIVAVEPAGSALLSGKKAGAHGIQGIGANFIPPILDTALIDTVIPVTEEQAYSTGRKLGSREGILAGISSGAALHAAMELATDPKNAGKTVVVLLPDSGERYLSTDMFSGSAGITSSSG